MPIEKILKIENVGKFSRLLPKGDVQFRSLNVVFGQNAYGKTTLAGILRSLQTGNPAYVSERAKLGGGAPRVEIRVDGQNAVFHNGKWNATAEGLEIFDTTFVSENVHTGEHVELENRKNLYQVVVGAAAVALARGVDEMDAKGRSLARDMSTTEERLREVIQAPFGIEEFIALKPETNVEGKLGELTTRLSALRQSKEILARREPEQLNVPPFPNKVLAVLRTSVAEVSRAAEERVRQYVRENLDARGEQWLRQGLDYLKGDGKCPFCTQNTDKIAIVAVFREYFSETYREHVIDVERSLNAVEQALGDQMLHSLQKTALENDARIRIWADLADLGYARTSLADFETRCRRLRELLRAALQQKLANPSRGLAEDQRLEAAIRDYKEGRSALESLNKSIAQAADEIGELKKQAVASDEGKLEAELRRLRNIQIREQEAVKAICNTLIEQRAEKKRLEDQKREGKKKLEELAADVLSRYEATINKLLRDFGASFAITGTKPAYPGGKASSTYQITIDSKTLDLGDSKTPRGIPCFRTALSAGDKSTLALAFFLARLKNDPDIGRKTVVFDDPLSSLDCFRMSCTQQEISWIAGKAAQTMVLSHDPVFLKRIHDAHEKATMKTLEIARDGPGYVLREWNVVEFCRDATHQAYFNLRNYLDSGVPEHGDLRVIARDVRPYVEGSLRHRFPAHFPEDEWLGDFIESIRQSSPESPLYAWRDRLPDLEAVNDYSKPFHHAGQAGQPTPNEVELRTHVERAMALVQLP